MDGSWNPSRLSFVRHLVPKTHGLDGDLVAEVGVFFWKLRSNKISREMSFRLKFHESILSKMPWKKHKHVFFMTVRMLETRQRLWVFFSQVGPRKYFLVKLPGFYWLILKVHKNRGCLFSLMNRSHRSSPSPSHRSSDRFLDSTEAWWIWTKPCPSSLGKPASHPENGGQICQIFWAETIAKKPVVVGISWRDRIVELARCGFC